MLSTEVNEKRNIPYIHRCFVRYYCRYGRCVLGTKSFSVLCFVQKFANDTYVFVNC